MNRGAGGAALSLLLAWGGASLPFAAGSAGMRPQLELSQAKHYAYSEVLKYVGLAGSERSEPWDPLADPLAKGAAFTPDYIVDPAAKADGAKVFNRVQAAVSRAVADSAARPQRKQRVYILVKPGLYRELLYVPAAAAPITLYGDGDGPAATRINARLDAAVSGASYAQQYGPQFAAAGPAVQVMYAAVKDRPAIGTGGSMTVWVRNDGFQARNISFENGYRKEPGDAGVNPQQNLVHHQAVALLVDGADQAQFENVRLTGFQDTLYLKSPQIRNTVRSFFHKSYIEGDVDFIFGDSTAYFLQTEIKSLGGRAASYVGAPNTNYRTKYGLVFDTCRFTHDASPHAPAGRFYLARQWFHNQKCTPYGKVSVPGYSCTLAGSDGYQAPQGTISATVLETVGKMAVLNSRIAAHIEPSHPWSDWNRDGTLAYRPAQFNADDYWANLIAAGIDPIRDLGYSKQAQPADPFLAEFNNSNE